MTYLIFISVLIAVFVFTIAVIGLIRVYALQHFIIDTPNDRSSHTIPTPRGGGAGIILMVIACIVLMGVLEKLSLEATLAFSGGGIIVAYTGWLDDNKNISVLWRMVLYSMATIWALFWLQKTHFNNMNHSILISEIVINIIFTIGILWIINLFNFMDGTDAFAAIQSICTSTVLCILFWLEGQNILLVIFSVILISSCGFLSWNFPPAKIFMGDVGSCTLGFFFGIFAIYTEINNLMSITIWLILLAPFIGDATFTLTKRIITKEKWYKAHNSHAYQRLYVMGFSHKKLVFGLLIINTIFMWPLSFIAYMYSSAEITMVLLAYMIVAIIWASVQFKYVEFKEIN